MRMTITIPIVAVSWFLCVVCASGAAPQDVLPDVREVNYFLATVALDHGSAELNQRAQTYLLERVGLESDARPIVVAAAQQYARLLSAIREAELRIVRTNAWSAAREAQEAAMRAQRDASAVQTYQALLGQLKPDQVKRLQQYLTHPRRPKR